MTYENLVSDIDFSEVRETYKNQVRESFKDRYLPLQLNGLSGNNKYHKRNNGELVSVVSEV